jgi:hypothetical protein
MLACHFLVKKCLLLIKKYIAGTSWRIILPKSSLDFNAPNIWTKITKITNNLSGQYCNTHFGQTNQGNLRETKKVFGRQQKNFYIISFKCIMQGSLRMIRDVRYTVNKKTADRCCNAAEFYSQSLALPIVSHLRRRSAPSFNGIIYRNSKIVQLSVIIVHKMCCKRQNKS